MKRSRTLGSPGRVPEVLEHRWITEVFGNCSALIAADATILHCTVGFADVLRVSVEKAVGSSVHDFVEPAHLPGFKELLQHSSGRPRYGHLWLKGRPQGASPVRISLTPFEMGGSRGFCMAALPRSGNGHASRDLGGDHLARSILDHATEAIVVCDEHGWIVRASQAAHRLCGADPVMQRFERAFPLEAVSLLSSIFRGQTIQGVEAVHRRTDGRTFSLLVSARPLRDDHSRVRGGVITLVDVTQRKQAEEALEFLARASKILAVSLDYPRTLECVARLALAGLADWCVIHMIEEGGAVRRTAAAHADPAKEPLAQEFIRRHPVEPKRDLGVARVLRTGQSVLHPEVTEELLRQRAADKEHLRSLRLLGIKSVMVVPIKARRVLLGTISFVSSHPARRYGSAELATAEELAHRAALAIDNARLYHKVQTELVERNRAEAELRRSNALLQAIIEGIADVVFLKDVQGRYMLINSSGARMIGKPVEECIGLQDYQFFPIDVALRLREDDRLVLQTGQTHTFDHVLTTGEGLRTYHSLKTPFRDVHGKTIGILGVSRDITERKRAEETQRFLAEASKTLAASLDYPSTIQSVVRLAISSLADWCLIDMLDSDQVLRREYTGHADPAKVEWIRDYLHRYPPDSSGDCGSLEVVRTGHSVLHPEVPDPQHPRRARNSKHLRLLQRLGLKSMMIVPMRARSRILGAITFISAESNRRYEWSDLSLAEDLAHRAALAIENARLFQQAQEAVRAREEFLSVASHELKTPLTSLQLQLERLVRMSDHGSDVLPGVRVVEALRAVGRQTERLSKLISSLLDLSRFRAGKLTLEPEGMDLAATARSVAERFAEELARSGSKLTVDFERPVPGRWDRQRIEQVVTNLLSNAIKYGEGKPIRLKVGRTENEAWLSVKDHGIGISPGNLQRLFTPFERRVSLRHYAGLGLGLYIVRQIVEAHGGTIEVTSVPGQGSTFTVRLPRPAGSP